MVNGGEPGVRQQLLGVCTNSTLRSASVAPVLASVSAVVSPVVSPVGSSADAVSDDSGRAYDGGGAGDWGADDTAAGGAGGS